MKVIEVLETQDILDKTFVPLSKVGSKQHIAHCLSLSQCNFSCCDQPCDFKMII